MSAFVGAAQHTDYQSTLEDLRLNRMDFQPWREIADVWAIATASFVTDFWPGNGDFCGDTNADFGVLEAAMWGPFDQAGGASSRFGFVGVTRDANGTAVGTCTVKLYRTLDDTLLDTTTSDTSGNFLLNTPYYPDAHYMVAHKSGSPDIDGVTPNNLIGT